jgi:hypothetical protein
LLLAAFAGCKPSISSIRGKVTYDGAAVARGQITFMPEGGHGVARSGKIEAGNYVVNDVPPGRKTVQIVGVKQIKFAKTQAEAAEAAKRGPPAAAESADDVPQNAEGNGQTVETAAGAQELNFDLKRPKTAGH